MLTSDLCPGAGLQGPSFSLSREQALAWGAAPSPLGRLSLFLRKVA